MWINSLSKAPKPMNNLKKVLCTYALIRGYIETLSLQLNVLTVLLNESKLTVAQRQKSKWENSLRTEDPPPRRHQASSGAPAPLVRPRTSRRRSLSTIRESGDYEVEGWVFFHGSFLPYTKIAPLMIIGS